MKHKVIFSGLILWLYAAWAFAQGEAAAPLQESVKNNTFSTLDIFLSVIAVLLLMVIAFMKQTLNTAISVYEDREIKGKANKAAMVLLLFFSSQYLFAQEKIAATTAAPSFFSGMSIVTSSLFCLVLFELLIIVGMAQMAKKFLKSSIATTPEMEAEKAKSRLSWWDKINNFRPIEQEGQMDTGHNYDGIRELDNITPPWFTTAFALSILFAIVYWYRYEVAHTGLNAKQEYDQEVLAAEMEKAENLSKEANKVDESNVAMLGASDIEIGKKLYNANCVACHKEDGGGGVGPNLTDKFWIHGGSIKKVFVSIKYGWQEKGMKPWKDDFSPMQIAQISSFVKSLDGTKPAAPKEAQGDLYDGKEDVAVKTDTLTKK